MDLLKAFIWKEPEVFGKVAEAIGEAPSIINEDHYAYWDRKSPIVIQAHIDVVSGGGRGQKWDKELGKMVKTKSIDDKEKEIMKYRNVITSRIGILGGDDRAGVAIIIAVNNSCKSSKTPLPNILLTNGEESGGTGMKELIKVVEAEVFKDVRIIIGLDRRGCSEYVTYIDPDKEVRNYIESFGFVKGYGSYSDSKDFSRKYNIPHVNLSVGYYDNHSSKEVVHIDEMLLTAKRVIKMLSDPIEKRYEIEEEKNWSYYKGPVYDHRDNEKIFKGKDLKLAAMDKRRKRCEKLQLECALPSLCSYYPYFDYLLTNEDINNGYHIVTGVDGARVLEEWAFLFNSPRPDKVADIWMKEFGRCEKIYIKSAGSVNKFHLAVMYKAGDTLIARSATSCEMAEERIVKEDTERIKKAFSKAKESKKAKEEAVAKVDMASSVEEFAQTHGYCEKYSSGECDGGCHGNRHYCQDESRYGYGDQYGWL